MTRYLFLYLTIMGIGIIGLVPQAAAQTPVEAMPSGVYKLDKTHASLVWKVSHLGLSDYTARFTNFDAELNFDPENPENSTLVATVDPTSVETDYPGEKDFNKKLAEGEKWFNAGTYPEIRFESRSVEKTGENTGKVTGELSMLGMTQPLVLDVTFNKAMQTQPFSGKPTLGFSATGVLERSQWGMDTYVPNIGDKVEILIEAELAKDVPEDEEKSE